MIFRRRKRRDTDQGDVAAEEARTETSADESADVDDSTDTGLTESDDAVSDDAVADDAGTEETAETAEAPAELDVAELDARDWREQGPYDIAEIDLEAGHEDPRIDLGSMIITGFEGAELRLQVADENQQIVSAMLISKDSALELGAFAAPRSGGLWPELREELIEAATSAGGSAAVVEGPFGVELRRLLPVQTPDGEQGYQPSRMWVAEGPRWLLRGIVYGQAALVDGLESPVAELLACFRATIVRRGDEARAPGDLLPLSLPRTEEPQPENSEGLEGAG